MIFIKKVFNKEKEEILWGLFWKDPDKTLLFFCYYTYKHAREVLAAARRGTMTNWIANRRTREINIESEYFKSKYELR